MIGSQEETVICRLRIRPCQAADSLNFMAFCGSMILFRRFVHLLFSGGFCAGYRHRLVGYFSRSGKQVSDTAGHGSSRIGTCRSGNFSYFVYIEPRGRFRYSGESAMVFFGYCRRSRRSVCAVPAQNTAARLCAVRARTAARRCFRECRRPFFPRRRHGFFRFSRVARF